MPEEKLFNLLPPQEGDYNAFYAGYVEKVAKGNIFDILGSQLTDVRKLKNANADHAYAPGKWTIKQLVQHMIDSERVFAYRLLRMGRGDTTPLPGFDENAYAEAADVSQRSLSDMIDEFGWVRLTTLHLIGSLAGENLDLKGEASGYPVTPRALIFIMAGHVAHHLDILKERYGVDV